MLGLGRSNNEINALISTGSKVFNSRGNIVNKIAQTKDFAKEFSTRIPNTPYTNTRGVLAYRDDFEKIIFFQFNPETIQDSKETEYADRSKPGQDYSDPIWIRGGARTIKFDLWVDSTQGSNTSMFLKPGSGKMLKDNPTDYSEDSFKRGSVFTHNPEMGTLEQVEFIQSLQRPNTGRKNSVAFSNNGYVPTDKFFAPPTVVFSYGPLYFEGVVTSVDVEHNLFSPTLVPWRSKIGVSFRVYESYTPKEARLNFLDTAERPQPFDFDTLGGESRPTISSPISTNNL